MHATALDRPFTRQPSADSAGRLAPTTVLELVDEVAAAGTEWAHLVEHNPQQRSAQRLVATDVFEVWLLGWTPGQRVQPHDHGPSHAAFRVVEGTLTELSAGSRGLRRRIFAAGSRRMVPSGTVHDVVNESSALATSIHAYSPPLSAMTYYDATATRALRFERVAPLVPILPGLDFGPQLAPR